MATRLGGSASRGRSGRRQRPTRRLLCIRLIVGQHNDVAALTAECQYRDHLDATFGEARPGVWTGSLLPRIATATGLGCVRPHQHVAIALLGLSRGVGEQRAHRRARRDRLPCRRKRRGSQRHGDQDRQDNVQSVQCRLRRSNSSIIGILAAPSRTPSSQGRFGGSFGSRSSGVQFPPSSEASLASSKL